MQIQKQDYVSKQTGGGIGIKMRRGGARENGPGVPSELSLGEKWTINMASLSYGVKTCLLVKKRHSLPTPGSSDPKGLEEASPGFPPLLFLNACSGPPVAPVSIQVHWLPSKPPELSFPGVCLGNPPVSMLPSWYLSTAKFRNHCPHSLDEVLLGWGHLSLNSGCCAGAKQ